VLSSTQETVEKLTARRDHLRRVRFALLRTLDRTQLINLVFLPLLQEVYERNLVMKGLIDRLRHLQYSMRLIRGGSSNPPPIIMESV
jgi:hypothetical protein